MCDVIKQNELELRNTDFKIQPKQIYISLFRIVFATLKLPVSMEENEQF